MPADSLTGQLTEWVAADGTVVSLNEWTSIQTLGGATGMLMPPVSLILVANVSGDGESLRQVRFGSRPPQIEVAVRGENVDDLLAQYRALIRLFNPRRGLGKLRVTSGDGTVRELTCIYSGGLEGNQVQAGRWWLRATISFRAPDPYWYDPNPASAEFTEGTTRSFFPLPPMRLGASSQIRRREIFNDGDEEAWPIWNLVGPFTRVELTNETPGHEATLLVDYTLASGFVKIDTRPGAKSVVDDAGIDRYKIVAEDAASAMWPLAPGRNIVNMVATGASAGLTRVQLFYFRRYLTT